MQGFNVFRKSVAQPIRQHPVILYFNHWPRISFWIYFISLFLHSIAVANVFSSHCLVKRCQFNHSENFPELGETRMKVFGFTVTISDIILIYVASEPVNTWSATIVPNGMLVILPATKDRIFQTYQYFPRSFFGTTWVRTHTSSTRQASIECVACTKFSPPEYQQKLLLHVSESMRIFLFKLNICLHMISEKT